MAIRRLSHPIGAVLSQRQASAARMQATPDTYGVCIELLQLLTTMPTGNASSYTILFVLCLAFACLRFSDLDRSVDVQLGRDALHATTWRSKGKMCPTPWAALRKTWTGVDWGAQFFNLIQDILPEREGWHDCS